MTTFILSVVSSTFGLTRFLKNGPMTLVPRQSYGPSFVLAMLPVAMTLVGKGAFLGALVNISSNKEGSSSATYIATWALCCLLPHFVYVSKL